MKRRTPSAISVMFIPIRSNACIFIAVGSLTSGPFDNAVRFAFTSPSVKLHGNALTTCSTFLVM